MRRGLLPFHRDPLDHDGRQCWSRTCVQRSGQEKEQGPWSWKGKAPWLSPLPPWSLDQSGSTYQEEEGEKGARR